MNRDELLELIAEANLAPSVHNTQPTRWKIAGDDVVAVFEDSARRLPVGDPAGRDAAVSHGAAIEGFSLACSARGLSTTVSDAGIEPLLALRPVALITLSGGAQPDPLQRFVTSRRTYRGKFAKRTVSVEGLGQSGDAMVVQSEKGIARLAALNDEAGLRTFRDAAFRAELLSWMRLSRRHPRWSLDGLNAEAMEMSAFEAAFAGMVLGKGAFEALDRLKLAGALVAEAAVVRSAQAIVLFHRPEDEPPLLTGRRFYRLWLEFTRAGLAAAPMAVLADDPQTRSAIANEFSLPKGRRLITAFRVGVSPHTGEFHKPRLDISSLVV